MSWFGRKKQEDPLVAREKELVAEVERLRREVGRLSKEGPPVPPPSPSGSHATKSKEYSAPVRARPTPPSEPTPGRFNEFGAAKYDLLASWKRFCRHFRGPTSNNPRMAKMLAAGSIQGLRTLRYERRVARNRFIALFVILLLILWGIGYTYFKNR